MRSLNTFANDLRHYNRLRAVRASLGVSQLDLALMAGMGRGRYWPIEKGYIKPRASERAKLAKVLGVSEAELFPAEG